eukprot:6724304-Prymnesium_polylepis.1
MGRHVAAPAPGPRAEAPSAGPHHMGGGAAPPATLLVGYPIVSAVLRGRHTATTCYTIHRRVSRARGTRQGGNP